MALDLDLDEDREAEADRLAIEDRAVAVDHAVVLERLEPAQAGRRRQVHALGERDVREPALALEDLEQAAVDAIQGHVSLLSGRIRGG